MAKGYTQKYGVDFHETFSPVVLMTTIHCILTLSASHKWFLHQLDVNNAFLHEDLHEDVHMIVPDCLPHPPNVVCKLHKSLYGLKQASRQWFAKLTTELLSQGFIQTKMDYSLFTHKDHHFITIVAIYVDDIIVTRNNTSLISHLKSHLHNVFSIKDLGCLSIFLGLELTYSTNGIIVTQQKFSKELIRDADTSPFTPHVTPLPLNHKLSSHNSLLFSNPTLYRSLVGKLNFLTHTHPNLSYAVQTLSQHMQKPTTAHFEAVKHTLGYLSATLGQGILLSASDQLTLQTYSNSDWGACPDTRRSISGFVLLLGRSPNLKSKPRFLSIPLRLSILPWPVHLLKLFGLFDFSRNLVSIHYVLLLYIVTTCPHFILLRIRCSMNAPNTWKLIVILPVTRSWRAFYS